MAQQSGPQVAHFICVLQMFSLNSLSSGLYFHIMEFLLSPLVYYNIKNMNIQEKSYLQSNILPALRGHRDTPKQCPDISYLSVDTGTSSTAKLNFPLILSTEVLLSRTVFQKPQHFCYRVDKIPCHLPWPPSWLYINAESLLTALQCRIQMVLRLGKLSVFYRDCNLKLCVRDILVSR